jgi:hypothetical protein
MKFHRWSRLSERITLFIKLYFASEFHENTAFSMSVINPLKENMGVIKFMTELNHA